jgi:hypothetical protein
MLFDDDERSSAPTACCTGTFCQHEHASRLPSEQFMVVVLERWLHAHRACGVLRAACEAALENLTLWLTRF